MPADHAVPAPPPPDSVLDACRRLAHAMDVFDEAACARLGVGRSDLRALNLLETGPRGAKEIGAALGLSKASVTQLIDRLERAGYVAREADPSDRRAIRVGLQPATFAAFAAVYAPLGHTVLEATTGLSARRRRETAAALETLATAFDSARAGLEPAA